MSRSRCVFSRVTAVSTLVVAMLLLAMPVSADVVANERYTFTITNPNPCAGGELIDLTFESHDVTRQLADGTLVVERNIHGTGVSTTGTEYVVNRHQVTTVVGDVESATFQVVRVSKGSGDNMQIEGTFTFDPGRVPPLVQTSTFRCVG